MKRWHCQLLRMSRDHYELHEGALLIADAHYSKEHPEFFEFLKAIESGDILTTQLILMGDIFDLLFGYIPLTHRRNSDAVALINRLSERIEILYLEGNHDFQLSRLFPNVHVVPVEHQPFLCYIRNKKVMLSHGDYRGDWKYRLYLSLIRSSGVLRFLNAIDIVSGHAIIKRLDRYLIQKDHCRTIPFFKTKTAVHVPLFERYDADVIIEGHFHQNRTFTYERFEYINLGAFACNQRYYVVQSENKPKLLQEVIF